MKLIEILTAVAILALIAVMLFPGKSLYSKNKEDALAVASSARACAILSLGNSQCQMSITGEFLQTTCSGGYNKVTRLNSALSTPLSITCSEGAVDTPTTLTIGNFQITISRRDVAIVNLASGKRFGGK